MCLITLLIYNGPILRNVSTRRKYVCAGCRSKEYTLCVHVDKVLAVMGVSVRTLVRGTYSVRCECGEAFLGPKHVLLQQQGQLLGRPAGAAKQRAGTPSGGQALACSAGVGGRGGHKLPTLAEEESQPSTPIAAVCTAG